MKQFLLFFIPFAIGTALFVWISSNMGMEGILLGLSLVVSWRGLILLCVSLLMALLSSLRWREALVLLDADKKERVGKLSIGSEKEISQVPAVSDIFQSYLVGFAFDYLTPMMIFGGEVLRANILREKHSIPLEKAAASVLIDRILELTSFLLFIAPGLVFFFLAAGPLPRNIAAIIFSFLFIAGGAITFFYFKNLKKESILRFFKINHGRALQTEKYVFSFFRSKRAYRALYLSFLKAGLFFLRVWIIICFLGERVGIEKAWPAFSFAWIGTRIPVPVDIGSHEAVQVLTFQLLGLGGGKGAALALIVRVVDIIISFLGLIFLFKFGVRFLEKNLLNKLFKNNNNEKPGDS